jgi:hypothetical protein
VTGIVLKSTDEEAMGQEAAVDEADAHVCTGSVGLEVGIKVGAAATSVQQSNTHSTNLKIMAGELRTR